LGRRIHLPPVRRAVRGARRQGGIPGRRAYAEDHHDRLSQHATRAGLVRLGCVSCPAPHPASLGQLAGVHPRGLAGMRRSTTMRTIIVEAFGGPEQLILRETREVLRARPGELLVDVEAAGVNYLDVMQR